MKHEALAHRLQLIAMLFLKRRKKCLTLSDFRLGFNTLRKKSEPYLSKVFHFSTSPKKKKTMAKVFMELPKFEETNLVTEAHNHQRPIGKPSGRNFQCFTSSFVILNFSTSHGHLNIFVYLIQVL